jgi:hypothetical protein
MEYLARPADGAQPPQPDGKIVVMAPAAVAPA